MENLQPKIITEHFVPVGGLNYFSHQPITNPRGYIYENNYTFGAHFNFKLMWT